MSDAATQMITSSGSGGTATPSLPPGATSNATPPSLSPEVSAAIQSEQKPGYMQGHPSGIIDFFARVGQLQSGVAAQKVQAEMEDRRHNAEQMTNALQSNPALAASQDFMKMYAKHTSPEMAQGMGLWAQAESMKRQQTAQQMQSATAPDTGDAQTPTGPQDLQSLIQQESQRADMAQKHYTALSARAATDPSFAASAKPVLEALKMDMENHQKLRGQYITEKYQTDKSAQSEQFQAGEASKRQAESEKLQGQRETETNRRFLEAQKQSDERLASIQDHSDRMQKQEHDFREHMDTIKEARSGDQRKNAFLKTVAGLAKQQTDLASKLNKGSDYDQRARASEVQAHNENIDSLKMLTDDPTQIDALDKLKLNVGAATPSSIPIIGRETPGAVGAGGEPTAVAAPAIKTDDPLVGKATTKPDGPYELNGKHYHVQGGKIVGYSAAGGPSGSPGGGL